MGGAFHDLVLQRADAIVAAAGRRPEIVGVLRRTEGDFDQILDHSDVVVELIGGTDPAREYVLRALRAGRHVVTANKQLIAQFGDELFAAARQHQVQLRFEAAVAGVVPVVRVIQESLAATEITKVFGIVNGTTNFILTEMATTGATYEDALRRAQELGYAEADPSDDVGGADAAAKMAILARLAFGAPVRLADVAYEGITEIQPDDIAYAKELGPVAEAARGRRAPRRRNQRPGLPLLPVLPPPTRPRGGPVQRGDGRGAGDHRDHHVGPRRGRCRDGVGGRSGTSCRSSPAGRPSTSPASRSRSCTTSAPPSTSISRWPTAPGCLARIADVLGRNEVSVRSVVQRGLGDDARLVMVMHEGLETRFFAALDEIATLDFLRAQPRAIRVIEEEFV